jgi:MFS family permease
MLVVENRRGMFWTFLPIYAANIGATNTQIGFILTLIIFVNSLGQVLWGRVSDMVGKRRPFVAFGEIFAGIVFLFLANVNEVMLLTLLLALLEAVWSMGNPTWDALISELSEENERGEVMGKLSTVGGVGRIVGVPLAGILIKFYGFSVLFYLSSLLMFLAAATVIWIPESHKPHLIPGAFRLSSLSLQNLKGEYAKNKNFSLFTALVTAREFSTGLFAMLVPLYITRLGANTFEVSVVVVIGAIATTLLMTPAGRLVDRVGKTRIMEYSLLCGSFSILLYSLASGWQFLIFVSIVEGVAWAAQWTSWFSLLSALSPVERRATFMGFHNMIVGFSWTFAPVFGGYLSDVVGLKYLFIISFALSMVPNLAFMQWAGRNREELEGNN